MRQDGGGTHDGGSIGGLLYLAADTAGTLYVAEDGCPAPGCQDGSIRKLEWNGTLEEYVESATPVTSIDVAFEWLVAGPDEFREIVRVLRQAISEAQEIMG